METKKLYYVDSSIREFIAKVVRCEECAKGWWVELDSTAFFPGGGGQACDLGTLRGPEEVRVIDMREQGDTVLHLCDGPLQEGSVVSAQLDWARRLDQMQQHSGEHIVSGIIYALFGGHNVGFHVGADMVTIDFDCPIPAEALPEIEQQTNEAIYANLPVNCWYPPKEQLPYIHYRSKKALDWPVRLVQIPGYDSCACCGVHTAYTGQVGLVKLFSCVKFHQGVRIEMACGARALGYLSEIYNQNQQVCRAFSAKPLETGAAAQRMNDALAAEKFRATGLERQLFDRIAESYVNHGNVLHFADDLQPAAVRELADRIAQRCGGTAAVFSGTDEAGYTVCLVNHNGSVAELGKVMANTLSGRGGGKPGFFQGSVKATRQEIETFFGKLNQFYSQ